MKLYRVVLKFEIETVVVAVSDTDAQGIAINNAQTAAKDFDSWLWSTHTTECKPINNLSDMPTGWGGKKPYGVEVLNCRDYFTKGNNISVFKKGEFE